MARRNCWALVVRIFDVLKKSAITKEFRPVDAESQSEDRHQTNSFARSKSHNVIGKLDGSDSKLRDEYVIYTAHWDHLGRHPELQGDQISNGAIDNASGVCIGYPARGRIHKN